MKAFPSNKMLERMVFEHQDGMDLRDYFAAKALGNLITRWGGKSFESDEMARDAYTIADSMMKVREVK